MKIEKGGMDNILNAIQKDSHSAQEKTAKSAAEAGQDKVRLSNEAKEYSRRGRAVKEASAEAAKAADSEKLMRLKNEIAQGIYRVSGEDIAAAMMGIKNN